LVTGGSRGIGAAKAQRARWRRRGHRHQLRRLGREGRGSRSQTGRQGRVAGAWPCAPTTFTATKQKAAQA